MNSLKRYGHKISLGIFWLFIFCPTTIFAQDNRIQDPVKNFDRLWTVFNERFANFELKEIDWDEVYKKYRPLIDEQTSNDSLFSVCSRMLDELQDGHVNLIQSGKHERKKAPAYPTRLLEDFPLNDAASPNLYDLIRTTYQTLKAENFSTVGKSKNGKIRFATNADYGYLNIMQMSGIPKGKVAKLIDQAIIAFQDKKGVIIDVRFNGGGDDKISHTIASRFTSQKQKVYLKRERIPKTDQFTELETHFLQPDGPQQFTKPVILITSDLTASAAEVFTMMMNELPQVTIIGNHTEGIFSDMYDFKLPNGWLATLSHQQYLTLAMYNPEGKGIQPDISLLNSPEEIEKGLDTLIMKALEILEEKAN